MEREEVKKIVKDILMQSNYGVRMPRDFSTDESLFLRGVIDSFGIFPFINELQKQFNVKIGNNDIHPGNLETVENIAAFIYKKKNNGG